ncbi:MAG: ComF family protein [Bacteroidia bacterium]|jgi:ComF family protein
MFRDFINLIYPNLCPICCDSIPSNDMSWCLKCDLNLPKTYINPKSTNSMHKALSYVCPVQIAYSSFYFKKGNGIQKLLHKLKYKGKQEIGTKLGQYVARDLLINASANDFDALLAVPLHPSKLLIRGYNQALVIAEAIAYDLNRPVLKHILERVETTSTQTKKSRFKRWENVQDAFQVTKDSNLKGKHIAVVDDVFTTGATLGACLKALHKIEGIKLSVLTVALADY